MKKITEKDVDIIKEIANELFKETNNQVNRELLLFAALERYLIINQLVPSFEVEYKDPQILYTALDEVIS